MNSALVRGAASGTVRQLAAGDVAATRTVYGVVLALVVIGALLIFVAVWMIRQTRPDPELLAPLERMADRSWRKQDPAQKRRSLDDERPAGANPLQREQQVPEVDAEFDQAKPAIASFDDLQAQQQAERRRATRDPLLRVPEASADDVPVEDVPASSDDTGDLDADVDGLAATDDD